MTTIREILAKKGTEMFGISPSLSVIDAIKTMARQKVSALLVLEDNKLKGIVSEQDYSRKVILPSLDPDQLTVRDIMTREVIVINPNQSVLEVMGIMIERHIRHLPVVHNGELVGMVSIRDLVKEAISEQQFIIKQLEQYIQG